MKIVYLLLTIVQAQFPMFLTKEALLNRCKQFAISDDDCMNSTYLPQKEYNNYLKSFNVPIIKDDYCNEGKCIAVIYKDEHKCTQCTDKNCLANCRKVIHTDNIVQQQAPSTQQQIQIQHKESTGPCSTCNTVTITKELTKTIDTPKTTTMTDTPKTITMTDTPKTTTMTDTPKTITMTDTPKTITMTDTVRFTSSSLNVVTSTLVSAIPTTSVLTVTKTDISTLSKVSTTTSTSTTSVKIPTVKLKTVTITKEQESSTVTAQKKDEAEVDKSQTVEKPLSSTKSYYTNSHTIPNSPSIITVTREVPTTVTVDRPLTLYREVTTTLTSEVPIVNYKVTTFTKNLISTIEKTSTLTTTEKSYLTEFSPLTSFITSISTETITVTVTAEQSASVSMKDTKSLFEHLVGNKEQSMKESQISPTVKIETIVSTLTKPTSYVTKEVVSTVTKSPEPVTSSVSPQCTENCDVKKDDEIDKLIPLLKELLVKEEKTTKKKKKHKSIFVNPETVLDHKKPKTIVRTIYSRRKKAKCLTKRTKCIDCDSTCEESSDILQGLGKHK